MSDGNKNKVVKNPVGRPVQNIIEPIKDSPENVVKSIMKTSPKKVWKYLKD